MNNTYTPSVSVVILNYNCFSNCLKIVSKLRLLKYPKNRIEIIIIDNASNEIIDERKIPKDIKFIQLKSNIGIEGWNYGFKAGKGELFLVLDDDSYPEENSLRDVEQILKKNSEIGILQLNIINPFDKSSEFKYMDQNNVRLTEICDFVGGGIVIKRDVFKKVGYFSTDIFMYGHEIEYSLRVLNAGYKIIYSQKARVFRLTSPNKINGFRIYNALKNFYWIYWKYLPAHLAMNSSLAVSVEYAYYAWKARTPIAYVGGVSMGVKNVFKLAKNKQIVDNKTSSFWLKNYPFTIGNLFTRAKNRLS